MDEQPMSLPLSSAPDAVKMASTGARLKELLGLETEAVAVFLLPPGQGRVPFSSFRRLEKHRYCQALMRARHGEAVLLVPEEMACPAAAAAFGFASLPEKLACGQGLIGFGIVSEAQTGRRMFEGMSRLPHGSVAAIAACPLRLAPAVPDLVVVEGPPEPLMWLLLADLNLAGGERRVGSTAVLQATCVDATVIPHLERRMNYSLGCYGCREATDLAPAETVIGFPGERLEPLLSALEQLADRAIPRSREKATFAHLQSKEASHG
jgi:uncharacterized protein (DUF169 family)